MKKFIPLLIMAVGVFSLASCRQEESIDDTMPITKSTTTVKSSDTVQIRTDAPIDSDIKDGQHW